MKPERPGHPAGDALARRMTELSAQLREEGVPLARDLWPDLERALDRSAAPGVPTPGVPMPSVRARRVVGGPWLTAALAATVLVAVGLGLVGDGGFGRGTAAGAARLGPRNAPPAPEITPAAAPLAGPIATRQGLRAVEAALDELTAALKRSPDDPDLSRLILMIHHSRGRLLRLQADSGVRDAHRGRG